MLIELKFSFRLNMFIHRCSVSLQSTVYLHKYTTTLYYHDYGHMYMYMDVHT